MCSLFLLLEGCPVLPLVLAPRASAQMPSQASTWYAIVHYTSPGRYCMKYSWDVIVTVVYQPTLHLVACTGTCALWFQSFALGLHLSAAADPPHLTALETLIAQLGGSVWPMGHSLTQCTWYGVLERVCVGAGVRACVRPCVRACMRVRGCVCVCVWLNNLADALHAGPQGGGQGLCGLFGTTLG